MRINGHVYYLGASTAGLLGLMDASEMVDTYGSLPDEIRAFVCDGWGSADNVDGDISSVDRFGAQPVVLSCC